MATIAFKGIEAYQKQLAALENPKTVEAMCKYAIYDAAGMVADEIRKDTPVGTDPRSSGDLRASVKLSPMETKNGMIYTKVEFAGYDRKGVPNVLIARILESGRHGPHGIVGKHSFVRKTVQRVTKLAEFMMEKAVNEYLAKIMKKGT